MATASEFLDRRVDRGTLPLAVGDVLVIVLFLYAGTLRHGTASLPPAGAGELAHLAEVVAPFLIGWVVVSIPIGAYSPGAGESAKASVPLVVRSWIGAAVIGLALRATPFLAGGVQLSFAAVMLVGGALLLGAFRALALRFLG
jgi:hypothetical protein